MQIAEAEEALRNALDARLRNERVAPVTVARVRDSVRGGHLASPARGFRTIAAVAVISMTALAAIVWRPEPGGGPPPAAGGHLRSTSAQTDELGPRSWSRGEFPSPDGREPTVSNVSDVLKTSSGYVAVGFFSYERCRDAAVWTSSDAVNWRVVTAASFGEDADGPCHDEAGNQIINAVVAVDGRLIALGSEGRAGDVPSPAVWSSLDGSVWDRDTAAASALGAGALVMDAKETEDGVIAIGAVIGHGTSIGAVWASADGRAWRRIGGGVGFSAPGRLVRLERIAAIHGRLFAVGVAERPDGTDPSARFWSSADGERWQVEAVPGGGRVHAVADGPEAVAVGEAIGVLNGRTRSMPSIWYAADATAWRPARFEETPSEGTVSSVVGLPEYFLAVGSTREEPGDESSAEPAVWASTAGTEWNAISTAAFADDDAVLLQSVIVADEAPLIVGMTEDDERAWAVSWLGAP